VVKASVQVCEFTKSIEFKSALIKLFPTIEVNSDFQKAMEEGQVELDETMKGLVARVVTEN